MKKLVLIDSHAIIYRAYHALPPMNTPKGEPVNAVYGFASILIRIIRELKPDYIAAAYDLPGPTFRQVVYERYKAHRPETPDELSSQFGKARELLETFGILVFQKESYEADDIIGTIIKEVEKKKDVETVIVTGDMDALQLVKPGVRVYSMKKGVSETVTYDEAAVKERYGLEPSQLVDFKGLKGDPSDNIAGVKGIGEKTATELLKNFKSIEGVYKALKKTPQRFSATLAEKLRAGEEDAKMSRELARIKNDVSIDFNLDEAKFKGSLARPEVLQVFNKFGFTSLIKRLGASPEKGSVPVKKGVQASLLNLPTAETNTETKLDAKFTLSPFLLKEVEEPLTPILRKMEKRGILLDLVFLEKLSKRIGQKIGKLEKDIFELAGEEFNINSTRELSRILFDKLKISTEGLRRTEKGGVISTGASELEKLKDQHEIIHGILQYRELAKLRNTYIDSLPKLVDAKDGRIHTTYDQFGAATGRLSSSNPNLQNIPIMSEEGREIRKAFVSQDGYELASFDYSQIELRVAAHLADDKKMIEAFRKGEDIHSLTASEVYNIPLDKVTPDLRRAAKTLNFGVLYGMGSQAFSESTGMSRSEAKKFIDGYFHYFAGVKHYIEETKKFARENGYVQTLYGRIRQIPEINSASWRIKREAERMAVNMPIQGTATGDIVKMAMVKVDKWIQENKLEDKVKMLLQVHDELVFEIEKSFVKKAALIIKNLMEGSARLKVPIVVEVKAGKNWGEQTPLVIASELNERGNL
ncbi:MAG: DNA polymerase I [bacterium]|nr:DNA polymerase I [bacterium]